MGAAKDPTEGLDAAMHTVEHPETLTMPFLERVLGMPKSTVSWAADKIPSVTKHGRPGRSRRFTHSDALALFLVGRLTELGVSSLVAIDAASQAQKHFVRVLSETESSSIPNQMVVSLHRDATARSRVVVSRDANELLEALMPVDRIQGGVLMIDLAALMREFWVLVLNQIRADEVNKRGASDAAA